MNITKQELLKRIEALEARLDSLTGIPRKAISMTEARIARERGDMATYRRFLAQYQIAGGDSGEEAANGRDGMPYLTAAARDVSCMEGRDLSTVDSAPSYLEGKP